jgi:hypothetical protein
VVSQGLRLGMWVIQWGCWVDSVGFVGVLRVCLWVGCCFVRVSLLVFVGALNELGFFFGCA